MAPVNLLGGLESPCSVYFCKVTAISLACITVGRFDMDDGFALMVVQCERDRAVVCVPD
jgi:hypothetical protein